MIFRVLTLASMVALLAVSTLPQSRREVCAEPLEYNNQNETDRPPLVVHAISGTAVVDAAGGREIGPASSVCLAVFTEESHRRIATGVTDQDGALRFSQLAPGRYRLVARAPGLCLANVPIQIVRSGAARRQIVVHLVPPGVDICSYGAYK